MLKSLSPFPTTRSHRLLAQVLALIPTAHSNPPVAPSAQPRPPASSLRFESLSPHLHLDPASSA